MAASTQAPDTIAAIATPTGRGGVAIVRVSGALASCVAAGILGEVPTPRRVIHRSFLDRHKEALDSGLAVFFAAPASFTGEDVLELHGHGGVVIADMLLARALELGARLAEPGEFSRRAFLNDKLDLAQAEAVADLIDSATVQAARAAVRSLQGDFSIAVRALTDAIIQLRMYVEAAIDFPEEEIDFLADERVREEMVRVQTLYGEIASRARQGALLRDGMTVVIAGQPNAGKSSLLNALAGHDAAIVTAIPGTTRDVLRERIDLDGMPLHVADTAGLRDNADVVEAEGIRRARQEMTRADRILYLIDASRLLDEAAIGQETAVLPSEVPVTLLFNKIDLVHRQPASVPSDPPRLYISATIGAGIQLLREHLKQCAGFQNAESGTMLARRRHLDALARTRTHLDQAFSQLAEQRAGEIMAEELRQAQRCLGEITGEFSSDELLGRIFSSFCIGK